jgi:mono/diheme cytochrome c family protein
MTTAALRCVLVIAAAAWTTAGAADVQSVRQPPALVLKSMQGVDLFRFYCASCHGCDAKGKGPAAPALVDVPTDLTQLSAAHGGVFPRERITAVLSGRGRRVPAHGSSDMPVWGPIFRGLDTRAGYDEIRIANLVTYLESIQGRDAAGKEVAPCR